MDEVPKKAAPRVDWIKRGLLSVLAAFTPKGIARFANAPMLWLLVLQFVLALSAACVVVWFLNTNYAPAIRESIRRLPDSTLLQNRRLSNVSSQLLAESKFISAAIDLDGSGQFGKISDVQLELRRNEFRICSLFGCVVFNYPPGTISLGRANSEPWWGAREPVILFGAGLATFVSVVLIWFIFALAYTPIAKSIAYFANRKLSWKGSWKLCSAAQLVAALLMTLAILFYGLQLFDLIQFLFFFCAHFVVAWTGVCVAPFFLPMVTAKQSAVENPFS